MSYELVKLETALRTMCDLAHKPSICRADAVFIMRIGLQSGGR
jgi:hypothetical protein